MADLRKLSEKEKAQYNAQKSVQATKQQAGIGQGLLDVLKGGEKPRAILGGLLGGDTSALSGAWNEVKQLADPNYMRNVKGINSTEAMDIALNANPVMAAHTVYHGSPHSFNKFDMSKLGSGEGAQVYGHGLYFAENPQVAKSYLVNAGSQKTPEGAALSYLKDYPSASEALDGARNRLKFMQNHSPDQVDFQHQVIKSLEEGTHKNSGSLYKVDLPDESIPKMLDWDKPLNGQHPDVEKILLSARKEFGTSFYDGASAMKDLEFHLKTPQAVSEYLKSKGITGVKYLDEGSRGHQVDLTYKGNPYPTDSGKFTSLEQARNYADDMIGKGFGADIKQTGTSNFVVFDDTMTRILEKNGVPTGQLAWNNGLLGGQ